MSSRSWAIVLGASSGFGAASALALARAGYNIAGVHLDTRATRARADAVAEACRNEGADVVFFHHEFDTAWRPAFWHNHYSDEL